MIIDNIREDIQKEEIKRPPDLPSGLLCCSLAGHGCHANRHAVLDHGVDGSLALRGRDQCGPPLNLLVHSRVELKDTSNTVSCIEDEYVKRSEEEHVSLRRDA